MPYPVSANITGPRPTPTTVAALLFVLAVAATTTVPLQAQTFTVIHNFSGSDGALPLSGVTPDSQGNLYGTTSGGVHNTYNGTVYELSNTNGGWTFTTLYSFQGGSQDGSQPAADLAFGPDGAIYGTTQYGGSYNCYPDFQQLCGVVYRLDYSRQGQSCSWVETVPQFFYWASNYDGAFPMLGKLVFDGAGNLYGTTSIGGHSAGVGAGTVFELTPLPGGWGWPQIQLWNFHSFRQPREADGVEPFSGLLMLGDNKLYGTTLSAIGNDNRNTPGAIYELTRADGSSWSERILHRFGAVPTDGHDPFAGLIADTAGNLYGATSSGGSRGGGTVYELTPAGGDWNFQTIYDLPGNGSPEVGPYGNLAIDGDGNLYGTTKLGGAYQLGSVFKLTRNSDGTWTYSTLHDFTGGDDGSVPWDSLYLDGDGRIFGTSSSGGAYNYGVVFQITQ